MMENIKGKEKSRARRASEANTLCNSHDGCFQRQQMSDALNDEECMMKRSFSRTSFRASFKASKSKLDEFFKSPLEFSSKRKRTRPDDDSLSLRSVDLNIEEPKRKRRSSLAKVTSLAALLSPVAPVKKVGSTLQKSLSTWALKSQKVCQYRDPSSYVTPPRQRTSIYWHETVNSEEVLQLDKSQIDRQEAIFELYKSEEGLIEDLKMVKTTYHDSMRKLRLMTDTELANIFGHLDALVPLHQELVDGMKAVRKPNGATDSIGRVLVDWVPRLEKTYVTYCANQVLAKSMLDVKKQDAQIEDFLERCQESPFSRHLDLWNFLDVPRSRLVKYPLLLKTIQKHTPAGHKDIGLIDEALEKLDSIIRHVDLRTGEAKCTFVKEKLRYVHDGQTCTAVDKSNVILCDGQLRNARGTKLHVCLFEKVLMLTRPTARDGGIQYQVYCDPIPVCDLVVEEVRDGISQRGSFKSVFTPGQSMRNAFRVSSLMDVGRSHTLQANDELDKRHWLQCIEEALKRDTGTDDRTDSTSCTDSSSHATAASSTFQSPEKCDEVDFNCSGTSGYGCESDSSFSPGSDSLFQL